VYNLDTRKGEIPGVTHLPFSINNPQTKGIFKVLGIDAVINLAGKSGIAQSIADPSPFFKYNVSNTISLLDLMAEAGIKKLIHGSSGSVYEGTVPNLPVEVGFEESLHLGTPHSTYAYTKFLAESIISRYCNAYDISFVGFRYFNVAGPGQKETSNKFVIPQMCKNVIQNEPVTIFGDGTSLRDYAHVDDIANAHVLAIDYLDKHPCAEFINTGSGISTSVNDIVRMLESVSGNPMRIVRQDSRHTLETTYLVPNIKKAKTLLGWEPEFTLEDIIRDTYTWEKKKK